MRELEIDWHGASFHYEKNIELETEYIGLDSTKLEIEPDSATGFTVTVGGVTITVDATGQVSVSSAQVVPLEVDDDDGDIEVQLPFALTPDMTIEVTGSIQRSILVADYYTAPIGKYELEASLAALPQTVDGTTLSPATLELNLTIGIHRYPGAVGLEETSWQKRTAKTWKFKKPHSHGDGD